MKIKLISAFLGILILVALLSAGHNFPQNNYTPKDGYVPNEETAIKIAEAIWLPIYGKDIEKSKPFVAHLKDATVWIVEGTLPPHYLGGVPYVEIRKSDCKILKVTHGK
jgi:hypothetical protein